MGPVRHLIAREVRGLFADRQGRGVEIAPGEGLFGPRAMSRRVHGDVGTMMIGGTSALLLQMLHPAALAGIWDHSNFRRDMHGRLRRTAAFIAITTYGSAKQAETAIARVRRIHDGVRGTTPGGAAYHANDPALLAFVHVIEVRSFLGAYLRYHDPFVTPADQDRYFDEIATIAERLGASGVPRSRRAVEAHLAARRPELICDARTREAARLLMTQTPPSAAMRPAQAVMMQAAIELLPGWARRLHGIEMPRARRPLVRAGAHGLALLLRWALARPAGALDRSSRA